MEFWKIALVSLAILAFAVNGVADSEFELDFDDGELEIEIEHGDHEIEIEIEGFDLHCRRCGYPAGAFDAFPTFVELRTDAQNDWTTNAFAQSGDHVDIRMNVQVQLRQPYRINTSMVPVQSIAYIYGRTQYGGWTLLSTTTPVVHTISALQNDTFFWPNAFVASDRFVQYRVIGYSAAAGETYRQAAAAFIDRVDAAPNGAGTGFAPVSGGSTPSQPQTSTTDYSLCGQIRVDNQSFSVSENETTNATLSIQNFSGKKFFVTGVLIEESSEKLTATRNYFDPALYPYGTGIVQVRLQGKRVTSDATVPVKVRVTGEFENGPVCAFAKVPVSTLNVKIKNVDDSDDFDDGSACASLTLETSPFSLRESDSKAQTFTLRNASGERFVVDAVEIEEFDSDFAAQVVTRPESVPANGSASVVVRASTGTLDSSRTGTFRISVRGRFSGGKFCSQDRIKQEVNVSLLNQSNPATNPASCAAIDLIADPVTLNGATSITGAVRVQNDSANTFFVESVNMYDASDHFILQSTTFDSFVLAGQTGKANYSLQALDSATDAHGTGFVQVSGKFSNGDTCNFNAVGTSTFPVTVLAGANASNCPDFAVSVPSRVVVDGDGVARVSFSVYNPTNRTVQVSLSGDHLSVSPFSFSVSPGETLSSSAKVTLLSGDSSNLIYRISGSTCNVAARFTSVASQNASFTGLAEFVSADSSAVFVSKATLSARVKNLSDETRVFSVTIEGVPAQWTAEEVEVRLEPNETQSVYVDVFSNGFAGNASAQWRLKSDGVIVDSRPVSLSSQTTTGLSGILDVSVSVVQVTDSKSQVRVAIRNVSAFQQSGSTTIRLPSGWSTDDGSIAFTLNPSETKTLVFDAQADALAQDGNGSVTVTTTDGHSGIFGFALHRGKGTDFLAGLVGLMDAVVGQWWIPLLVVLAVLLVFWLINRHYENKYPPRMATPPFAVTAQATRQNRGTAWRA